MDTVLSKQTISTFGVPPEDTNSKFLWNTANLYLFTNVKTWGKRTSGWFMHEKLNYKYHISSEPNLHEVILLHFVPHLSYGICCLVKWNDTVKGQENLKAASHSEMYNVMRSTYIDGFTVNKTTQDICKSQNKNETNMTTGFTTEHDNSNSYCFS